MTTWSKLIALGALSAALGACGGDDGLPPLRDELLSNTYAYRAEAPEAAAALRCAKAETVAQSCSLATLAPIAFTHPQPSVANIMERVLVSHPWMGQRFEQLLMLMPEDIHYLLGGVTAIVIDDDIRPSYYTRLTGAIYLDPANLWLTPQEREQISAAPDYRAAYAGQMSFRSLWRYNIPGWSEPMSGERSIEDIEPRLAALLFHELAHANDIFPRHYYQQADVNQSFVMLTETIAQQTGSNSESNYLSTIFQTLYPLNSQSMLRIAEILYKGYTPTAAERALTAAEVGAALEQEGANDEYAYTSQFEDLAMLFEEAMMKLHYGAERDIVFANLPAANDTAVDCDDYTVGWGMRNRLGDPAVKPRAQWVVEHLLTERDYSILFDTLEPARPIPNGLGWCTSASFEDIAQSLFYKSTHGGAKPQPFDPRDAIRAYELQH